MFAFVGAFPPYLSPLSSLTYLNINSNSINGRCIYLSYTITLYITVHVSLILRSYRLNCLYSHRYTYL